MKKLIALLAMLVIGSGSVFAGFWDWSTPYQGPDKDVITLVITGNYKTSRTMAELIQYETRQPFILLPYSGAKGIFFCPAGGVIRSFVEKNTITRNINPMTANNDMVQSHPCDLSPPSENLLTKGNVSP